MQQTPLFLFHATTGDRAKQILASGRFEAQEQLFESSQSEYNYFYIAEDLLGIIHYQSLVTALVADTMDICLLKIPIESVKEETVYRENFETIRNRKHFSVSEVVWDELLEDDSCEEVLLKSFSFDSETASLLQLNWNAEYTTKQFLQTLGIASREWCPPLQKFKQLPYFLNHLRDEIDEYNEGSGDVTTDFFGRLVSNLVVTVKFDNEFAVNAIFKELFHAISELEWFTLMDDIDMMLTENILPQDVEHWSSEHDSYEKGYIELDVKKLIATV